MVSGSHLSALIVAGTKVSSVLGASSGSGSGLVLQTQPSTPFLEHAVDESMFVLKNGRPCVVKKQPAGHLSLEIFLSESGVLSAFPLAPNTANSITKHSSCSYMVSGSQ